MSEYVTRLIERARGELRLVEPRKPSRFETGRMLRTEAGSIDVTDAVHPAETPPEPRHGSTTVARRAADSISGRPFLDPHQFSREKPAGPYKGKPDVANVSTRTEDVPPPELRRVERMAPTPGREFGAQIRSTLHTPPEPESVQGRHSAHPNVPAHRGEGAVPERPASRRDVLQPVTRPEQETWSPPNPTSPSRSAGPASHPGRAVSVGPPEITISIGRIEVRAVRQTEAKKTNARPFRPELSLEDYLARRDGGR
jgi:hypothetical protein